MYSKPKGWSCKKCHKWAEYGKMKLFSFERLCSQCVKEQPAQHLSKAFTVTIPEFITTVQLLIPHWFRSFHLNPCGQCNMPTWSQPCWWCGYYPQWSMRTKPDPKEYLDKAHWDKQTQEVELILHYIASCFNNCASTNHNDYWMDMALERAKIIQWPSGDEIWEAFGPLASVESRKLLHPWGDHMSGEDKRQHWRLEGEGQIEYLQWCVENGEAWARTPLEKAVRDLERVGIVSI